MMAVERGTCAKCRESMDPAARRCPHCGSDVHDARWVAKGVVIAIVIIVIVYLIVAAFYSS